MSTVLLLGATGFIGTRLATALRQSGYDVVWGVHAGAAPPACRIVPIDYTRDHTVAHWLPRLAGIDAVVNAVGILRETEAATFEALHVDAPTALFRACVEAGVAKVVQISAIGADLHAVSRYHASKKRADDVLATLPLSWVIVQPSLVFGEGGASAALLSCLAVLPLVPLPGNGGQLVQPIHVDDLCETIVRLVGTSAHDRTRLAAVGPQPFTLRAFLGALRAAMGLGTARFLPVPMGLVRFAAAAGQRLRGVLLDPESLGMLLRGNTGSAACITAVLGRAPRAVETFVPPAAARAMASEARLAWLLPVLRMSIALVWIATAVVSFGLFPVEDSYALLARVGLTGTAAAVALYGATVVDLAFGIGILILHDRQWLWRAQMALIVAYSAIIAIFLPEQWLHPYGPMVKNLPMLAAILMLHELERRGGEPTR